MKTLLKKIAQKFPLISIFFKKLQILQATIDQVIEENNNLKNELTQCRQEIDILQTQRKEYISVLYQILLEKQPESSELNQYFNDRSTPQDIVDSLTQSSIYKDKINQQKEELKNYILSLYKYILDREPQNVEVELHLNSKCSPIELFNTFTKSQEYKDKVMYNQIDLKTVLGVAGYILGEQKPITANIILNWYKKAGEELVKEYNHQKEIKSFSSIKQENLPVNHSPNTTIVTSLYRGKKFLKTFLENITNQTFFSRCELVIIDANSPENEYEIIKDYLGYYNNINYMRLQETIGIYESWNLAIKETNSEFITNANVDDLHRFDGLELKTKALMENPSIDVVYSDIYYSFIENLPFEIAEKCNIRTHLPVANKDNLLKFNSPHNSPIWRRSLHDKIGYFDTSYKSAADYEFWLRAAVSGSSFMKLAEPVVLYYHNPQGMSTKQKSPGQIEGQIIIKTYKNIINNSRGA